MNIKELKEILDKYDENYKLSTGCGHIFILKPINENDKDEENKKGPPYKIMDYQTIRSIPIG